MDGKLLFFFLFISTSFPSAFSGNHWRVAFVALLFGISCIVDTVAYFKYIFSQVFPSYRLTEFKMYLITLMHTHSSIISASLQLSPSQCLFNHFVIQSAINFDSVIEVFVDNCICLIALLDTVTVIDSLT